MLVPGLVIIGALRPLGLRRPVAFALGMLAFAAYRWRTPRHRGSIHTVRSGVLFGAVLCGLLIPLTEDVVLSAWGGLCPTLGQFVHLWKDHSIRL